MNRRWQCLPLAVATVAGMADTGVTSAEGSHTPRAWVQYDSQVVSAVFTRDGWQVITGSSRGVLRLWDARTGAHQAVALGHAAPVFGLVPTRTALVVAYRDGAVQTWRIQRRQLQIVRGWRLAGTPVALSPNGAALALISSDGRLRLWNVSAAAWAAVLPQPITKPLEAAFSADGRAFAAAQRSGTVWLRHARLRGWRQIRTGDREVVAVALSPDGRLLASGSATGRLQLWNAHTARRRALLRGPGDEAWPSHVLFSGNGRWLAALTRLDLRIWSVPDGRRVAQRSASDPDENVSVAFSPDGRLLACGGGMEGNENREERGALSYQVRLAMARNLGPQNG